MLFQKIELISRISIVRCGDFSITEICSHSIPCTISPQSSHTWFMVILMDICIFAMTTKNIDFCCNEVHCSVGINWLPNDIFCKQGCVDNFKIGVGAANLFC